MTGRRPVSRLRLAFALRGAHVSSRLRMFRARLLASLRFALRTLWRWLLALLWLLVQPVVWPVRLVLRLVGPAPQPGLAVSPAPVRRRSRQFAWAIERGGEPRLGLHWEWRPHAFAATWHAWREPLPALPADAEDAFRDADVKPAPVPHGLVASTALHLLILLSPVPAFLALPAQTREFNTVRIEYDLRWTATSRVLPPISPAPRRQRPSPGGQPNQPLPPPGAKAVSRQTVVSNPPNPNHPTQTLITQFGTDRANVRPPQVRLPNMVVPPSADAAPNRELNLNRMKVPNAPVDLTGPPRSPNVPKPKSGAELALERTRLENLRARMTLPTSRGDESAAPAPEVNAPLGRARSGDVATSGVIAISPNPSAPAPVLELPDTNLRARFSLGPNAGAGSPGGVPGGVPGAEGGSGGGPGGEGGGAGGIGAPDIYVEPAGPVPAGPVIVAEQFPAGGGPPPPPKPASAPAKPAPSKAKSADANANSAAAAGVRPPEKSAQQRARELMQAVQQGTNSPRQIETTYSFISSLTSQSSTWTIRYAERTDRGAEPGGPAHVAQRGALRLPNITPPEAVKKVDPCYPYNPGAERVDGTVILYGVIRADGVVEDVTLVNGVEPRINQKATRAFSQSFFTPARKNGQPISVEVLIEIPFRMVPCL